MHPVATTEALKESCNLSLSWTLLTRRDYLPVKPPQEIIWASIAFLSALYAKAKQQQATSEGAEVQLAIFCSCVFFVNANGSQKREAW